MSGTVADISLVHWKQQWLENGTLYFHVSMSSSEQLEQATPPTLQEPSEIVEEQLHILHISVMGGLIALLLLLLLVLTRRLQAPSAGIPIPKSAY
ncbi:astrotactin-2-like [Sphaerodactylus townsendi]|uniref:astrotactin-2-like n=1 Tax=Sphaerodactylus townsendi TaxID=933632 RepID=UPI002026D818|nr:astrotactin-2-like [Sphaerodactylus townsendi]